MKPFRNAQSARLLESRMTDALTLLASLVRSTGAIGVERRSTMITLSLIMEEGTMRIGTKLVDAHPLPTISGLTIGTGQEMT
jgi:hypothetical protein